MVVIGPLSESTKAPTGTSGRGIQPLVPTSSPVLERKPQPTQVQQPVTTQPQKKSGFIEGAKKFGARTVVGFGDLISESLDFTTSFVVDNPIFNLGATVGIKTTELLGKKERAKKQKEELNKWKDVYKTAAEVPKLGWDKVQQTEYIRPSDDWSKAPLKEKLTKRLGETLAVLGPNIAPSFVLYALNPVVGVSVTVGSTANDVKSGAIKNGVPEGRAELLGLGTGILVGALDRIVPDELFSPAQKSKFISGFAKRIIPMSLKEAGTEVAQENLQLAAEATFRKDLGWDEVQTRNALAGLGGLLGGTGATTVVGTINQSFSQDILLEQEPIKAKEVKTPEVIEPITKEETNVVKVSEEPVIGKKLKIVEEPKPVVQPTQPKGVEVKPTEVKPKKVEVPRQQLPVGEGRQKESRLEARIKESLDTAPDEVKNLSTYNQMNKQEQIAKAVDYVSKNPNEALQVLAGEKEAPSGLLNNSIFVAMQNQSRGDVDLARKLATLASTRGGQEISILTEIDPDSPVKLMKEIVDIRAKRFGERYKGRTVKQAQDTVVENIKKNIKVPNKNVWNSFLNSIEC
ncbi:MAG TPA: hypothetical protein VFF49_11325 [Thermodesulfobacteriota bacterium]|nr:hypothetical protein [Thermodesulfobacteriota bacterium]